MKPASLAALLFRLIAIYLVIFSLLSALIPTLFSMIFSAGFSGANTFPGQTSLQIHSPFAGLLGIQLIVATLSLFGGVMLYIWSYPLGKLIARGLD